MKRNTLAIVTLAVLMAFTASAYSADKTTPKTDTTQQAEGKSYLKKAAKGKKAPCSAKVNPNTATSEQLETLAYVGAAKAQTIIAARADGIKFRSASDLMRLKGISLRIIETNKACLEYTP